MNKLSIFKLLSLVIFFALGFSSCTDDEPETYQIPTTYNFENVSYSGQTQRLAMLQEMKNYMSTANTTGITISADRLKAMYANDSTNAGFSGTYDYSKQLKNKTLAGQETIFEGLFEDFEAASQSIIAGTNGQAGVVVSLDGVKAYLMNDKGLEYTQVIEKGLMGACLYYQSTAVYFGDDKMNVDNETVEPGEGTAMEHHWDEAFGYFAVPIDFPTNTDGLAFWGDYCNDRDAVLGTNAAIMDNFLKGRAAISNNDLTARDEAIIEIQKNWELVSAGTAIHYLNSALANFNDDALRNHALSEVAAFVYALNFNPNKKVTTSNIEDLLVLVGGDKDFADMNFYLSTEANLNAAKDQLATYYSLEDEKDNL